MVKQKIYKCSNGESFATKESELQNMCTGCHFYETGMSPDICKEMTQKVGEWCHDYIFVKVEETKDDKPTSIKDTNPKDSVGIKKSPLSVIPTQVIHEVGLGMMEGALKYGRHNYRIAGVRASVYYDATMRHLNSWWEGEDIDPASKLSHITKAITSLVVLRDAMLNDLVNDDRPPKVKNPNWMEDYNKHVEQLILMYPDPVKPYTEGNRNESI